MGITNAQFGIYQGVSANTVDSADGWGGAIFNAFGSHAVIDQNLFSGNSASGANADGGAIYNQGDLIIKASSFLGNQSGANGGALANHNPASSTTVIAVNTTFNGNNATKNGGAIYGFTDNNASEADLFNVTIDSNKASGSGGGIYLTGTASAILSNTVVSNNTGGNCAAAQSLTVTNASHNLVWPANNTCTSDTALTVGNPMLNSPNPIKNFAQTLNNNSAASRTGDNSVCNSFPVLKLDQSDALIPVRPSPSNTNCDIGAYESGNAPQFSSTPGNNSTINISSLIGTAVNTTIKISNTGQDDLIVALTSAAPPSQFTSINPNSGFTVSPNGNQDVVVTCTPDAVGPFSYVLTYSTNDPATPNASFTINCTGLKPIFDSAPVTGSTINLTSPIGTPVNTTIAINNKGTATLNVTANSNAAAPFSVNPTGNLTLNVGSNPQNVVVTCTPASTNLATYVLKYNTNDTVTPSASYTINCTGTNTPTPIFDSTPGNGSTINLTSPIGTPVNTTITISNQGTATLDVTANSSAAAPFSVNPTGDLTFLAGSNSQDVVVTCTPTSTNAATYVLKYNTNDPNVASATYTIVCTGLAPAFSSNPVPGSTVNLTSPIGTPVNTTIIISNKGTATLNVIANSSAIAPFSVNPTGNLTFNVGSNPQNVVVTCTPTSTSLATYTLKYNTNDTATPSASYTINCTGSSVAAPIFSSTPAVGSTINLTSLIGTAVNTTINIKNIGTAQLDLTTASSAAAPFVVNPSISFSLAPNNSQDVVVTCTPTSTNQATYILKYNTNDSNVPLATYTINCTGSNVPLVPGYGSTLLLLARLMSVQLH